MEIVAAVFRDKQDLSLALEDLSDAGFVAFEVFGPAELFREPVMDEEVEESIETQHHTAGGVISGISVNPRPLMPDDPSAQRVLDDLMSVGLPEDEASPLVAALQQDQLVLLLQTKTARADKAAELMEERAARMVRTVHPDDAFPEEQWSEPREESYG